MTLNEFIARATGFFDKAEAQIGASADVAKLTTDLAASTAEITTLKAQLAEAAETNKKLAADLAAKDVEIESLKGAAKKADAKADATIAAQGVPPEVVPPAAANPQPNILSQFEAISDPTERGAFWAKHKAEIVSARRSLK